MEYEYIKVYTYDINTKRLVGSIEGLVDTSSIEEPFTEVEPPHFNPELHEVVFNELTLEWGILDLPNPFYSAKKIAKGNINKASEQAIGSLMSQVANFGNIYFAKYEEAERFIASGTPTNLSEFPLIQTDVDVFGGTPTERAQGFIEKHNQWISLMNQIERIRLSKRKLVDDVDISDPNVQKNIDNIVEDAHTLLLSIAEDSSQ